MRPRKLKKATPASDAKDLKHNKSNSKLAAGLDQSVSRQAANFDPRTTLLATIRIIFFYFDLFQDVAICTFFYQRISLEPPPNEHSIFAAHKTLFLDFSSEWKAFSFLLQQITAQCDAASALWLLVHQRDGIDPAG